VAIFIFSSQDDNWLGFDAERIRLGRWLREKNRFVESFSLTPGFSRVREKRAQRKTV
jgi:hypothetical protein